MLVGFVGTFCRIRCNSSYPCEKCTEFFCNLSGFRNSLLVDKKSGRQFCFLIIWSQNRINDLPDFSSILPTFQIFYYSHKFFLLSSELNEGISYTSHISLGFLGLGGFCNLAITYFFLFMHMSKLSVTHGHIGAFFSSTVSWFLFKTACFICSYKCIVENFKTFVHIFIC